MRASEVKDEIYGIEKWKGKIKGKDLKCRAKHYIYDFQQYETLRSFGDSIYSGKIEWTKAEMDQSNLLKNVVEFCNKSRPRTVEDKKRYLGKCICSRINSKCFQKWNFPIKATKCERLKTLTPKQMPQRLPIALAKEKAGNTSENLLNEIRQIIYSLYRA